MAEQGTAIFRALLDDGELQTAAREGAVPEELEALFRVYDGEVFYTQQEAVVARILEKLQNEA